MYLIVDKSDNRNFRIVKDYADLTIDDGKEYDCYCGITGPNKGLKVAVKHADKSTFDCVIE